MGRLLAIVIVFVGIALLINNAMQTQNIIPTEEGEVVEAPSEPNGLVAKGDVPVAEIETASETTSSAAIKPKPEATIEVAVEASQAADILVEPPASEEFSAASEVRLEAAKTEPETVLLGSGNLLTGIPGEGDLTAAEIDAWLADPKNHVPLSPELPLGLAAGAAEIKGLDENPLTRAKIELGRQLYFDTRLSSDNTVSCASCHDPEFGFAKNTRFGVGVAAQEGGRNSPVAYNRILSGPQFWDGRAESLEAQAVGPIANPIEMGNTHDACIASLREIPGYVKQFEVIFDDGINIDNVGKAIATFERAIVTGPAPWDYYQEVAAFEKAYSDDLEYIKEERANKEPDLDDEDLDTWQQFTELQKPLEANPISESAIRGGKLFFSEKAGCTACHVGANFADEKYHNLGVGMATTEDGAEPDWGRYTETNDDKDRGAFKTPTVRNVSLTGPFMHDGSQETLEEVVEWYVKGGHPNPHLSEKVKKLDLTDQDKKDLVAFMAEGLKSDFPKVESGRLPE